MIEERLIKIRKKENRGATGELWKNANETKNVKLIKEINKILLKRRSIKNKKI